MNRYFLSYVNRQRYLLIFGDAIVISLSFFITNIINFTFFSPRSYSISFIFYYIVPWAGIFSFLYILTFYIADIYTIDKIKKLFRYFITIFLSVLIVSIISSGILFFFTKYIIGRKVIIVNIPIVVSLLILWRFIFMKTILERGKPCRLALIGNTEVISDFVKEFSNLEMSRFIITQIFLTGSGQIDKTELPESVTICKAISDLLKNEEFDALAFDSTNMEISVQEISQLLQLKLLGKPIYEFPSFFEDLTGKIPAGYIDGRWLLSIKGFQGKIRKYYKIIKRLVDIVLSTILLIITFPLFMLIVFAIKLDSRGKVIFLQERLGIIKHPFICYKFRTMGTEAEKETGPIWSNENDLRVTRVGKILRKTRLDELPQLWNILIGDMSFVGNRPIRKYFADLLSKTIPFYDLRFLIKPGLSGWAQVNLGYSASKKEQFEKFQFELFYIKNMSLFLDIYIIFKTIKIVFQKKGT